MQPPGRLSPPRTGTGEDRAKKGKICEKVVASKGFGDYHGQFGE